MLDRMYDTVVQRVDGDGSVVGVSYHECTSFSEAAALARRIINLHLEEGWEESAVLSDVNNKVRLFKEDNLQTVEVWLRPTL